MSVTLYVSFYKAEICIDDNSYLYSYTSVIPFGHNIKIYELKFFTFLILNLIM